MNWERNCNYTKDRKKALDPDKRKSNMRMFNTVTLPFLNKTRQKKHSLRMHLCQFEDGETRYKGNAPCNYVNVVTRSTLTEASSVENEQDDKKKKYAVLKPERTPDSLKQRRPQERSFHSLKGCHKEVQEIILCSSEKQNQPKGVIKRRHICI